MGPLRLSWDPEQETTVRVSICSARWSLYNPTHHPMQPEGVPEVSPDEVIHLASVMQFSGFHSVIGTMWVVEDVETIKR